jgi:hypothetical protein
VVPCSQHLLQAVEGLVEPTHLLRVSRVNKAGWLTAINYLGECDMEEGVLDVKLVHSPTRGDIQSRHNLDGDRLDDRVEGLIIVHTGALSEPPEDPTNLVPAKRVIRLDLVLKDHLLVMMLAPGGRGTKSHVLLDIRASYSSIARH